MVKRWVLFLLTVSLTGAILPAAQAQETSSSLAISVSPGYDGYFREDFWTPLRINVRNDGPDLNGRLVVRPETSGSAVTNTFSAPISLPSGSRKTAFLYITARSTAQSLRLELLDDDGLVYTSTDALVRAVQPQERLYVVVSRAATGSIDLTGVTVGSYPSFQANWLIDNLPEKAAALDAVDLLLFSDVDTGTLSAGQRQAIADWVAAGGHLLVTGGANWQATAAGLETLLPFKPENSQTVEDMAGLVRLSASRVNLSGQAIVSTGTVWPDAQILAETAGGLPLILRRFYGAGTVDYLTPDPNTRPLRGWDGLNELWFNLAATVKPRLSWLRGFSDWEQAIKSVEILPGINLLPEVLALCVFLGAYIGLVGPLNYLILARINRREWAWVTIPVLIITFSVAAWILGFNLRGNEVTLSRLTVVQSWATTDRARVEQLVGLLSPRRANYSLSVTDGRLMRPIPRVSASSLFGSAPVQTNTNIQQTEIFAASDFPVDASFIASFSTSGVMAKPNISGKVTLTYNSDGRMQQVRGSVRNDSEQTLNDPVILARGVALRLNAPLEPGDLAIFDGEELTLPGEGIPSPSAFEPPFDPATAGFSTRSSYRLNTEQSAADIIGLETYQALDRRAAFNTLTSEQEARRRQAFLRSFMLDQYGSPGRGNRVFLAGWTDSAPLSFEVEGANWRTQDTTLYIVELELEFVPPSPGQEVIISPDQFTWVTRERSGLINYSGPTRLRLTPGDDVVIRFTPLPGMVLARVDELTVRFDQTGYARRIPLQVWDWQAAEWTELETTGSRYSISNPQRYLGPLNMVQLRLMLDTAGGYLDIGGMSIEQRGRF